METKFEQTTRIKLCKSMIRLKPPKESQLARKRTIPQRYPGITPKKAFKMTVVDKSKTLATKSAKHQVKEFSNNHITVQNNELFCLAHREPVTGEKALIVDHIGCQKHSRNSAYSKEKGL